MLKTLEREEPNNKKDTHKKTRLDNKHGQDIQTLHGVIPTKHKAAHEWRNPMTKH